MNPQEFNKVLKTRIELTKKVLAYKSGEYSTKTDKLHNFKRAGQMQNCSSAKALIGMWTKHIVSILDIVDNIEKDDSYHPSPALLEEKIGDAINYLILLEALIKERYDK